MLLAQKPSDLGTIGGAGLGPFGKIAQGLSPADGATALQRLTVGISSIIGVMTIAAGVWFIFQTLTGGFFWITSSGDKAKLHEARERITNAFIGLLIVVAGWALLAISSQFFGVDFIISNPAAIIQQLQIH